MHLDIGSSPNLLFGRGGLEVIRTDLDATQRYEGQMPVKKAFLDGSELRLVGLNVDVDVLQLAKLLAIAVDDHLPAPFSHAPCGVILIFRDAGLRRVARVLTFSRNDPIFIF